SRIACVHMSGLGGVVDLSTRWFPRRGFQTWTRGRSPDGSLGVSSAWDRSIAPTHRLASSFHRPAGWEIGSGSGFGRFAQQSLRIVVVATEHHSPSDAGDL